MIIFDNTAIYSNQHSCVVIRLQKHLEKLHWLPALFNQRYVTSIILLQYVMSFFPTKPKPFNIYNFIENVLSLYDSFQKQNITSSKQTRTQKPWKVKRFHNFFSNERKHTILPS